ncbi:MAG: hypothetical protein WEC14_08225 [Chloroflexota bacterium]
MPFDFLKRGKRGDAAPASSARSDAVIQARTVPFDGLTEEWRMDGLMHIDGRLSDALNKRESIELSGVRWGPIDGSAPLADAPGIKAVDPYDLIIVLAGEATLPPLTEPERAAHKVHKVSYDVALEVPPFRVIGTVYLHPGSEPERLLDRATEMFVPVVDAVAYLGDRQVVDQMDAILVNRFYLRGVEQVDRRTGQRHQRLPGAPLGGVSWQDRSR